VQEIYKALVKAQANLTNPEQNKEAKDFKNNRVMYRYASLDGIINHIRPVFKECGLAHCQKIQTRDDGTWLITTIFHECGEYIESEVRLLAEANGRMSVNQQLGAAVTYMRRYQLASMLGLSSDADTDDNDVTKTQTDDKKKKQNDFLKPNKPNPASSSQNQPINEPKKSANNSADKPVESNKPEAQFTKQITNQTLLVLKTLIADKGVSEGDVEKIHTSYNVYDLSGLTEDQGLKLIKRIQEKYS